MRWDELYHSPRPEPNIGGCTTLDLEDARLGEAEVTSLLAAITGNMTLVDDLRHLRLGGIDLRPEPVMTPLTALVAASTPPCDHALPDCHRPAGEPEQVATAAEGCGAWFPPEFRLCAQSLKERTQLDLLRRDGHFYAQRYAVEPGIAALGGRCVQGAFFHMQECNASLLEARSPRLAKREASARRLALVPPSIVRCAGKKRWDDGASHIDPTAAYDTFRLSQDGIERLVLPDQHS